MDRRQFLRVSLGTAAGAALLPGLKGCGGGSDAPPRVENRAPPPGEGGPPNIVLIMADDVGPEVLASYGGQSYRTPNLNRLAREGTRFTHCYATPMCTPSRVEMLTGRYSCHTGWDTLRVDQPKGRQTLDPDHQPQLGQVMQAAGYDTAACGKWQVGWLNGQPRHVSRCGFDTYRVWDHQPTLEDRENRRYWYPTLYEDQTIVEAGPNDYGPDMLADFADGFIRRKHQAPFFLYYPMVLPHAPHVAPPGVKGARETSNVRFYDDAVHYLDGIVGRLLATLERTGQREDTLILFTSDNGSPPRVSSRRRGRKVDGGKHTLTDAGICVPLLASRPGAVPAGRVYRELVDFTDFLPTCARIGRSPAPPDEKPPVDGHSFADQLHGDAGPTRDWIFSQYADLACLRTRRWKLMTDGRLYNMEEDPWEQHPIPVHDAGGEAARAVARLDPVLRGMVPRLM